MHNGQASTRIIIGCMSQLHTVNARAPGYLTAGGILASLVVASVLDLATAQSLSRTDLSPSHAVKIFQILDMYASPVAFIASVLTLLCWAARARKWLRPMFDITLALSMIALLDNVVGLVLCLFDKQENPAFLLLSAALVYVENIAVFVAFYWRFDHAFQQRVADGEETHPGILFPHSTMQTKSLEGWRPAVIDYVFLSFNTSSTFGPTLPVPLRGSIQLGMMVQVAVAMTVLVMLAARAIGLIG